jgi:glycosyltransferase involved in cell wall biosynthesis
MDKNIEYKHLVIITGAFPFLKNETFLEAEIIFLSRAFHKITLVPTKVEGQPRTLPENVSIDTSYSKKFKGEYRKLKSAATSLFLQGLIIHKKYLFKLAAVRRINSFVSDALITKKWLGESIESISANTIIYTYWFNGKTYGAELFAKKNKHVKIVSRAHRYDLYDYWFKPVFWPFRQQALDRLDFLYLISTDGENYLKSRYNLRPNKQGVYRLGVIENNILTTRSVDNILRIVTVSGLMALKRIELLAQYLVTFCKRHFEHRIHWTHIGDGVRKPPILEYLGKNILANLSYEFKGQQNNDEVFEFYRNNAVDLFINISESEGVPVSIMEAQSCGILVAATNVGGSSEIVNENSGILLPANPGYEIFENLLNHIKDYLMEYPSGAIKKFWNENYNANSNYKKIADHLSNL